MDAHTGVWVWEECLYRSGRQEQVRIAVQYTLPEGKTRLARYIV